MKNKSLWITIALVNLCLLALFGLTLRTKFLFPIPALDYRNFLSAHSHFAFGGWVTLALMILMVNNLLTAEAQNKKFYQWMLIGVQVTSLGMLISFPFVGYTFLSIFFSSVYIFFTYGFCWRFFKDLKAEVIEKSVRLLSIMAIACLVISSLGPFFLAYMLATKIGNRILYNDSVYSFMHFQYNGFFTFSALALFFHHTLRYLDSSFKKRAGQFAIALSLSIVPALFSILLSESLFPVLRVIAYCGSLLLLVSLVLFFKIGFSKQVYKSYNSLARLLMMLAIAAFIIKLLLQIAIVIPQLKILIFGFRPIIIGFLHMVFLAFVTFSILSNFIQDGILNGEKQFRYGKVAVLFFCVAVLMNEVILLAQGVELIGGGNSMVYPWLLWIVSILLFSGAVLILTGKLRKNHSPLLSDTEYNKNV